MNFDRVVLEGKSLVSSIIGMHAEQIKAAFEKNNKNLNIMLSLKFTPDEGEDVKLDAGISFIEGKIKDGITTIVSDQPNIPGIE